jgi:hypothetical protein
VLRNVGLGCGFCLFDGRGCICFSRGLLSSHRNVDLICFTSPQSSCQSHSSDKSDGINAKATVVVYGAARFFRSDGLRN